MDIPSVGFYFAYAICTINIIGAHRHMHKHLSAVNGIFSGAEEGVAEGVSIYIVVAREAGIYNVLAGIQGYGGAGGGRVDEIDGNVVKVTNNSNLPKVRRKYVNGGGGPAGNDLFVEVGEAFYVEGVNATAI